jgi:predicted phosphoribosyltransferase
MMARSIIRRKLMLFENRTQAGIELADKLAAMRDAGTLNVDNAVVIALPRGGVPPGYEIARALRLPLDVCVVRKVGAPGQPELALAAVAEGGELVVNADVQAALGLAHADIVALAAPQQAEVLERIQQFRAGRETIVVRGKTVILVDDGLATGATALASIHVLKHMHAARIILALPVCPASSLTKFRNEVDELLVLRAPAHLGSVGQWYRDFSQVSDEEVRQLLLKAAALQTREKSE